MIVEDSDTGLNVRAAVLEELAALLLIVVDEVEAQVVDSGGTWPGDSLLLAEVLVAVEERLGIAIPMDEGTMQALASVDGLVDRVSQLLEGPRNE